MDPLHNEFLVRQDIDRAFALLTDLEAIAPCLPGASLEGRDGDDFLGSVKVKLGAISANFGGAVRIVQLDQINHTVALIAKGREKGGRGMAEASISARLDRVSDSETRVVVDTELKISGKIAQFGRGIISDVSRQLIDQFAQNLDVLLSSQSGNAAVAGTEDGESEPASLDLGSVVGKALARRLVPLIVAVAFVVVVLVVVL